MWANIKWGVTTGFKVSLLFCAWICVLAILERSTTLTLSGGHSISAIAVILLYLATGVIAGGIVGSVHSFAGTRLGAPIVGLIATAPFYAGMHVATVGLAPWTKTDTLIFVICTVGMGPILGIGFREINRRFASTSVDDSHKHRTKHRATTTPPPR